MIFHKTWVSEDDEDGNSEIEAPPHIEIQVQVQMLVSGLKKVYLCVLVGGNDLKIVEREANPEMQEIILARCAEFWKSIDENCQPAIDYNKDSSFLISLYGTADADKAISVDDLDDAQREKLISTVTNYIEIREKMKALDEQKDSCKAQILEVIGDAAKIKGDEWSISAGNIDPAELKAHVKKGYRNFKVTKKTKKATNDEE